MKTFKILEYASIGSIAVTLLSPSASFAEADLAAAADASGSHSLVHRVSHSLADAEAYTSNRTSGYKWGDKAQARESEVQWAKSAPTRGGYKWGNSDADAEPKAQTYAGAAAYQWGSMSFADQAAYKWGIRTYADQSAYKWGIRNYADQSAYKWGIRNYADQSAYKWGIRNYADQSAYKWGIRNYADQSAYKWGIR